MSSVLGCSDPVYYPSTGVPYGDNRFEGLPEDSGDSDGGGTGGGTGDDGDDGGPTSPFEGVPCSDVLGSSVSWSWDQQRQGESVQLHLLDETCALVSLGGAGLGTFIYDGLVGEVYVFTDEAASVAYAWIQIQATNPDPVVIQ